MSEDDIGANTENKTPDNSNLADSTGDDWGGALEEQGAEEAAFDKLENSGNTKDIENPDLDLILDIPVKVSLEVGRDTIDIRKLATIQFVVSKQKFM